MSGVRGMAKMIFRECGAWTADARPGVLCEKNDDRLHRCALGRVDEVGHPHPGLHWCACRYEWSEEQVLDVRPERLQVVELKSGDVLVLETEGQFSDAQLETLHRQLRERFGHDVRAVVLERMTLAGVLRTEASWLEAVGETTAVDVCGVSWFEHDVSSMCPDHEDGRHRCKYVAAHGFVGAEIHRCSCDVIRKGNGNG